MIDPAERAGARTLLYPAAALLAVTLALGGAGADYPLTELAVESASLVLLAAIAWRRDVRLGGSLLAAAALLAIALPLLQLIPLPPSVWTSLPGREQAVELLGVAGKPLGWRPLTLDSEATWASMLAMMPALALFLAAANLGGRGRFLLALIAVGFGVLGALLGALQVASGPELAIVPSAHAGFATGLFSNRNHQAAFLVVAILLCGALGRAASAGQRPIALGAILLMAAGVLATTSRAGAAMLLVALPVALAMLFGLRPRPRALIAAAAVAALCIVAVLQTSAGDVVSERFGRSAADGRLRFWADVPAAIASYWPFGSGFGTFPTVFQAAERLDFVGIGFANHAHNDFLELAVEGGLIALLAIAAGIGLLAVGLARARRADQRRGGALATAAGVAIALLLLHSTVDYPLRMLALAGLSGLLFGLLAPLPPAGARVARRRVRLRGSLVTAAAAVLMVKAAIIHVAADRRLAASLAPYSPTAASFAAVEALKAGEAQRVERAALEALEQAPMRPEPVALLGLARQALGDQAQAARLMTIAGAAGWRDPVANLWLLDNALAGGDAAMAARRGDALLRQGRFSNEVLEAFAGLAADPGGRAALAERLAADPPWRRALLVRTKLEPGAHRALLQAIRELGLRVSEEEAATLARRLLSEGQAGDARQAWSDFTGPGSLISDGSFDRLAARAGEAPPVPFEWRLLPLLGARVAARTGPGGAALRVEAEAGTVGPVAEQTLALAPGRYRISATGIGSLRFELHCGQGREPDLALDRGAGRGQAWADFQVPPGCPVQRLRLWLSGDGAGDVRATIDEVRLVPAR